MRNLFILFMAMLCFGSVSYSQVITKGDRYTAPVGDNGDYQLGIGDKIRAIVYNEESLSGEFQVNSAGNLAFPLIGDVKAMGQTTSAISKIIQAKLADGYLINPKVSIEVLTYRPYFILGEVRTPQQYPYASGLTAFNAIASAGGFTPRAEKKRVYIRRSGSNVEEIYRLTPDLRILPGDTVRIGERIF